VPKHLRHSQEIETPGPTAYTLKSSIEIKSRDSFG